MTKLSVLWLAIISFIAVLIMFLFHASIFQVCYGLEAPLLSLAIPNLSPTANCLFYSGSFVFLLLFLGSSVLTLIAYAIYVLIYNRPMPSTQYLLWLTWAVFLYLILFEYSLFPTI